MFGPFLPLALGTQQKLYGLVKPSHGKLFLMMLLRRFTENVEIEALLALDFDYDNIRCRKAVPALLGKRFVFRLDFRRSFVSDLCSSSKRDGWTRERQTMSVT